MSIPGIVSATVQERREGSFFLLQAAALFYVASLRVASSPPKKETIKSSSTIPQLKIIKISDRYVPISPSYDANE